MTVPTFARDRDTLLQLLDIIDTDGWGDPAGSRPPGYVRHTVVRPLVTNLGLRGAAASQAEASGWQEVWATLTPPARRSAGSPWGVIWKVALRAVHQSAWHPSMRSTPGAPGQIRGRVDPTRARALPFRGDRVPRHGSR